MSGQEDRNERSRLRTMPWWVALLGAVVVAASAAVTTVWLLSIAGHSAQLRIEAIKVGLGVGAGSGGAFALMLAVRRQWLNERTQAHAEDVARITQAHAEAVARDTAYDATQRRVTELYAKAVEQLGHANASIRLGGLYSLERLAQDHPEQRQTAVNVICAYLRMPFDRPQAVEQTEQDASQQIARNKIDAHQELQVRLAAQRLLGFHLRVPPIGQRSTDQRPDTYWDGMGIDLAGALLIDFSFSNCRPYYANFARTEFSGHAWFEGAQFSEGASFKGAQFSEGAWFDNARFSQSVWFDNAQFYGDAWFEGTQFKTEPSFYNATANLVGRHTWPAPWELETPKTPKSWTEMARLVRRRHSG